MSALYTLGEWHAKPGAETQFVEAWNEFAQWTVANVPGSAWAKLLRDDADPRRFVSFGPWRDEEAVAGWRAHPGFSERVGRLQEHLESFLPATMTAAAEAGLATPEPQ